MILATTTIAFLNTNSGAIQALSTVFLVLLTAYYALQTKWAVKEAANTRKDLRLPIIRVGMEGPIGSINYKGEKNKYIRVQLENIGYGLARNVRLFFPGKDFFEIENLDEKEATNFSVNLDLNEDEKINELPDESKIISISYDDIFGRSIKTIAYFKHNHRGSWIEFDITDWQPVLPK